MKKRITSLVLCLIMVLAMAVPASAAYAPQHTAKAEILYELGLFRGTGTNPDGTPIFALDKTATRMQGLIMLIRLLGEEEAALAYEGDCPFTDVSGNSAKYAAYAYSKGYTAGTTATTFGNGPLKANAFLTFTLRALGYNDKTGDFTYGTAYLKAAEIGLIAEGECADQSVGIYRDICAYVAHNALVTKVKGGGKLVDKLIASGAVDAKKAETSGILNASNAAKAESLPTGSTFTISYYVDDAKSKRYAFDLADIAAVLPNAYAAGGSQMETNDADKKFKAADFSVPSLYLDLPDVGRYCCGMADSLTPFPDKMTRKEGLRIDGSMYTVITVIDKDCRLLAYSLVGPDKRNDGKLTFTVCNYEDLAAVEAARNANLAEYQNAVKVDPTAFVQKGDVMEADRSKLPESVKDFQYFACAWGSGNAPTEEQKVRSALYGVESDPLRDTPYSRIQPYGTSVKKGARPIGGGSVLFLYDANKVLVGYCVTP